MKMYQDDEQFHRFHHGLKVYENREQSFEIV